MATNLVSLRATTHGAALPSSFQEGLLSAASCQRPPLSAPMNMFTRISDGCARPRRPCGMSVLPLWPKTLRAPTTLLLDIVARAPWTFQAKRSENLLSFIHVSFLANT